MGIPRQDFQVTDTVMTRPRLEDITKRQGTERGIAPRASTSNRQALLIHQPLFHQVLCHVHTIVHIHNPPLSLQTLAIRPPITGAAPIIYIQHGQAPAGPVLDIQPQQTVSRSRWPTMTFHH